MSRNKYRPHLQVLPEDDANRQMVNGFKLHHKVRDCIDSLPPARGWRKVLESFEEIHIPVLRRTPQRLLVLLIDSDDQEDRCQSIRNRIPADLMDRVFVLGTRGEPENLKIDLGPSFESIGARLAKECAENSGELWNHEQLRHNAAELERLRERVQPFLFES